MYPGDDTHFASTSATVTLNVNSVTAQGLELSASYPSAAPILAGDFHGDGKTDVAFLHEGKLTTGNLFSLASCRVMAMERSGHPLHAPALPVSTSMPYTLDAGSIPAPAPGAVSVTPSSSSGATQTLSAVYYDPAGVSDLSGVLPVVNGCLNGSAACFAAYSPGSNALVLSNDAGTAFVSGSITPGGAGTLSNSQCTLTSGDGVVESGNSIIVPFSMTSKAEFDGGKTLYWSGVSQSRTDSCRVSPRSWTSP